MFKKLKLLKFDDIIEYKPCKLAFQVKENIVTKPILALSPNNLSNIVMNVNITSDVN